MEMKKWFRFRLNIKINEKIKQNKIKRSGKVFETSMAVRFRGMRWPQLDAHCSVALRVRDRDRDRDRDE